MTTDPNAPRRPLTDQQRIVAELVGRGLDAPDVARRLGIRPSTVRSHVNAIALLLPNPDHLGAYRLVMLWAAHERWMRDCHPNPPDVPRKIA